MEYGSFAVIGGDKRCAYVAQLLIRERFAVKTVGLELSGIVDAGHINTLEDALATASYVILPLPLLDKNGRLLTKYTNEKLDIYSIIAQARRETVIFAGKVSLSVQEYAKLCGKEIVDYYLREELQVLNAVPTAEGAIEMMMKQMPSTIFGAKVLITGFGRTAQALAALLKAMSAHVTIAARRREAQAHAQSLGYRAIPLCEMEKERLNFDVLVNTIPAVVVTEAVINKVQPECYLLDIASAPGGIDFDYALKTGIAAETALSLPGIVAPKTAGDIIKKTVLNIIEERGLVE